MREILFRGKRKDNGKWVQGSLFERPNQAYIIPLPIITSKTEVDPETVGQFTGLTDKNGTRIFEGDIVKFGNIVGIINYNEGCYCVKTNKPDWRGRNNPAIDIVLCEYENEVEVIGNIHDNPELIRERKDND